MSGGHSRSGPRGSAKTARARVGPSGRHDAPVSGFVTAVLAAFGVVFVAELGDKTQLLALSFGARYPLRVVIAGLAIGYAAAGAVASLVGGVLGAALPERPLALAGGVVFLVFAALGWREARRDDADGDEAERTHVVLTRSALVSIGLTIALAEFGDKTQLATATLAARGQPVGTWIGATVGEVAAGTIGAVAGSALGTRVPERSLRLASAALFAVFGVVMLVSAW